MIGRAQVAELIHIPFRVSQTPQSDDILAELLSISNAKTDKDLMDLALAAGVNGRSQWLDKVIADDAATTITWRQRRAELLSGFRLGNTLPVDEAWPEGELSGASYRRYQSAKWRLWKPLPSTGGRTIWALRIKRRQMPPGLSFSHARIAGHWNGCNPNSPPGAAWIGYRGSSGHTPSSTTQPSFEPSRSGKRFFRTTSLAKGSFEASPLGSEANIQNVDEGNDRPHAGKRAICTTYVRGER